jgi:hypothetical protein
MSQLLDNQQLRADLTRDILTDADLAELCASTAQTARRRRTIQQARVPILSALIILTALFIPKSPQQQTLVSKTTPTPIPATPALAHTIIATQPFANIITSEPAPTISTPTQLTYRLLTDDELLQLLEGYALAFHRTPTGRLQLEFLDTPQIQ